MANLICVTEKSVLVILNFFEMFLYYQRYLNIDRWSLQTKLYKSDCRQIWRQQKMLQIINLLVVCIKVVIYYLWLKEDFFPLYWTSNYSKIAYKILCSFVINVILSWFIFFSFQIFVIQLNATNKFLLCKE